MVATIDILSDAGWSWSHLVLSVVISCVLFIQIYRWMTMPLSAARRLTLILLRMSWSLLLLWCLWQPVAVRTTTRDEIFPKKVIVAVDVSSSMGSATDPEDDRWKHLLEATDQLQGLLDKAGVKQASWLALGSQLRPWQRDMRPLDSQSLVFQQLSDALQAQPESSGSTCLFLLSDGQDTRQTSIGTVITALRNHRTAAYPILLEGATPAPPFARLEKVDAPRDVFVKQDFEVTIEIRARRDHPVNFTVILDGEGHEIARKNVTHQGSGTVQARFPMRAEKIGQTVYTAHLKEESQDLGQMSASVSVKARDAVRVLYAQGSPEWEYRYVRQAVNQNSSIILEGITQINDKNFRQTAGGAAQEQQGSALAALQAAIPKSDVIVLANVNPEMLGAETQKLLLELVQKRGGGILFFTGDSSQASSFHGTLLEECLPVTFDPKSADSLKSAQAPADNSPDAPAEKPAPLFALKLTDEGLASEIWSDASATGKRLGQPPATFSEYVRIKGAKPGGIILGVHPTEKSGDRGKPLFVSQNVGSGRSAFLGINKLWKWRMESDVKDRDYDRFWQQLFLWLGGRGKITVLETDRGNYQPGETVQISIASHEASRSLSLVANDSAHHEKEIPLTWNSAFNDAKATFIAPAEGEVIFSLKDGSELVATKNITVGTFDIEKEFCGLNEPVLQELALETGGKCLHPDELGSLPSLLEARKETMTKTEKTALWHSPWIFMGILALYGTELVLRKRFQLI